MIPSRYRRTAASVPHTSDRAMNSSPEHFQALRACGWPRDSQEVRQRSANPIFVRSIPTRASRP